jgi:hypothetical protein
MANRNAAPSIDAGVMPHIDFTAIPDQSPIPAGRYNASIADAKPGKSKAGHAKIDIRYKIEGSDHDGRLVFDTISFHPNAQWRAKQTLQAINPDVFGKQFAGQVDVTDLLGEDVVIHVIVDTDTGTDPQTGEERGPRNRVHKVMQSGSDVGLDDLPLDDDE